MSALLRHVHIAHTATITWHPTVRV